jgi:guanylate kinase
MKSGGWDWQRMLQCKGEIKYADKILIGKPQWKRHLSRLKRRWEDNTKINLKKYMREQAGFI